MRRPRASLIASAISAAVLDREHRLGQQRGGLLGALGGLGGGALGGLAATLSVLQGRGGRRLGELARQQVVAQVAG
jgi:hypothetical protein